MILTIYVSLIANCSLSTESTELSAGKVLVHALRKTTVQTDLRKLLTSIPAAKIERALTIKVTGRIPDGATQFIVRNDNNEVIAIVDVQSTEFLSERRFAKALVGDESNIGPILLLGLYER